MGTKRRMPTVSQDYLQACWEFAGEIAREIPYMVQFTCVPTTQPGVWQWACRALHVVDGKPKGVVAQVRGTFPNSGTNDLAPFMYKLINELDAVLAQELMASAPQA